jgi:hypothetical protein
MDYVKKAVIIAIIALAALTIIQTVSANEYQETIYPTFDGYIKRNLHQMINTSETNQYKDTNTGYNRRAYFKWDISSIPDSATITHVSFVGYISAIGNMNTKIYSLESDPSSNGESTVWSDCGDGTLYLNNDLDSTGWKNISKSQFETHLEENLSRDWWGLGFSSNYDGSYQGGDIRSNNYSDSSYYPYLWIKYQLTAPQINDSKTIPEDFNTSAFLNTSTCINITHDQGTDMNITWFFWNETSDSWEQYATNGTGGDGHTLSNGTYCQDATWADTPCTTYYWYVNVSDAYGNETIATYTFTTHCVEPPTNFGTERNGSTGINVTFTPMPDYQGTTYTEGYYVHGNIPPSNYGQGTLIGNTTGDTLEMTDLLEGQTYGVSLWTIWQAADGTWYRSSSANSKAISAAGGDFRVAFFWEEPKPYQPINFSQYPANLGTHIIKIHYYDHTEDDFTIEEGNFLGGTLEFDPINNTYYVNISAVNDVWFVELVWFSDFNESGLPTNQTSRTPYRRILTSDAAQNVSLDGETKDTFFFYLANMTTYGANYYYYNGTVLSTLTDTDFENSIVKYDYSFTDLTNQIMEATNNNIFLTLYERNITGDVIIHQEYLDTTYHINPALIYEKKYLMSINVTTDTSLNIQNLGLAPTDNNIQPIIIISREYSEAMLERDIDITYTTEGSFLNVSYKDNNYYTTSITLTIYEQNLSGSPVYNNTKASSDTTFSYTSYNSSKHYIIVYDADLETIEQGYDYSISVNSFIHVFEQITQTITRTAIDNLIIPILGTCPIPGVAWSMLFIYFIIFILTLVIMPFSIPGGFLAGAVAGLGLSALIGAIGGGVITVSILLGALGFITLLGGKQ